ncbi:MAG: hypothetical protein E7Z91_04060 [Cyanobacteria bacterium SIG30]|nr:hypothetical protein [Cyanobacteria bacterium SIG30]
MFHFFVKSLIVLLVALTLFIGVKQPKMHTKIKIYDSSYTTQVFEDKKNEDKIIKKEETKILEKKSVPVVKEISKKEASKKEPIKKTVDIKLSKKDTVEKTDTKQDDKDIVASKKIENNKIIVLKNDDVNKIENDKIQNVKTEEELQKEELIAWNIWHSNLQNSLMNDVKMPNIPNGIIFKFSFVVDKYGKITNINTYSTTPSYTPHAVEYIAPVIRSYQGKEILNFPQNSKRTTTVFSGGWKMSDFSRYSSPSDYNDIEKIKK